jgi:hypothetical protein
MQTEALSFIVVGKPPTVLSKSFDIKVLPKRWLPTIWIQFRLKVLSKRALVLDTRVEQLLQRVSSLGEQTQTVLHTIASRKRKLPRCPQQRTHIIFLNTIG